MAFSLEQVKANSRKQSKIDTHSFFGWINDLPNISINTKYALTAYLRTRLVMFGTTGLELERFKYLVKDLLKNCCDKEFMDITTADTVENYTEIVFQLKWAIIRYSNDKRTLKSKSVYVNKAIENIIEQKTPDKVIPKRVQFNSGVTQKELEQYFSTVEVI